MVVALELLTVAVVSEVCFKFEARRKLVYSLLLGVLSVAALSLVAAKANAYVWAHLEYAPINFNLPPASSCKEIEAANTTWEAISWANYRCRCRTQLKFACQANPCMLEFRN